jgi:hypothetical protein
LIWRLLFELVDDMYTVGRSSGGNEERMLLALRTSAAALGSTWPSELRNRVNYGAGIGYCSVRRRSILKAFGRIQVDPATSFSDGLTRLENNVAALPRTSGVMGDLNGVTSILIDVTFILDAIAKELLQDVVERRRIDKRWNRARSEFFEDQFRSFGGRSWPHAI